MFAEEVVRFLSKLIELNPLIIEPEIRHECLEWNQPLGFCTGPFIELNKSVTFAVYFYNRELDVGPTAQVQPIQPVVEIAIVR